MSSKVSVRTLVPREYDGWGGLVAGSPDGTIYGSAEYLDILARVAGGRYRILGVHCGEELVGGLPLYEQTTPYGVRAGPRLLLYYHGPVLRRFPTKYPSQQTAREVEYLGALADAVAGLGYAKVVLRPRHTLADVRPFVLRNWQAWPSYSYVVPLCDLPGQWGRVEQNLRRLVERCTAQGVNLTDDDDFPGFLRLHALTMGYHGTGLYLPDAAFRQWFRLLHAAGRCRLFSARLPEGQAVATQLVLLGSHSVCHTVSAGSDPAHRQLGASAFLRWRVFERLAALGYAGNDLTDAALNPVTHFKSQLGGNLVMNPVVETRGSTAWRLGTGAERAYWGTRTRVGSLVRRLIRSAQA